MLDPNREIRSVAVLGAGVMGAQIAAHLGSAGMRVLLYDLPGEKSPNQLAKQALNKLVKLKPDPLASSKTLAGIETRNFGSDLDDLAQCDLIVEAVSERLEIKRGLYEKIMDKLPPNVLFTTNTSGIPIGQLADVLPASLRPRFCGMHFFNPPRYMHLLELIPHSGTDPQVLDQLEGFLTTVVGKGVIRAKDCPNFIGNRIGVFAILAVIYHAERLGLSLDVVDRLTGPGIGRPKSATFRTADVVGLDTLAHVVDGLSVTLPNDPWHKYFQLPDWIRGLIERGSTGQKSGLGGIYRKTQSGIEVWSVSAGNYEPVQSRLIGPMREFLKERDTGKKWQLLEGIDHPQAEFVRSLFLDLFHYCAVALPEIAHCARDVDLAMRWGYGWKLGPFETWQSLGWKRIADKLEEAVSESQTMADAPLPGWVKQIDAAHKEDGSWDPQASRYLPRTTHPVYRRQMFRQTVFGETVPEMPTVYENEGVRLWDAGDQIAVLSFKSKGHTIGPSVLDGTKEALRVAEHDWKGMVIWQDSEPFSFGANLKEIGTGIAAGTLNPEQMIRNFQRVSLALRYSSVPTVAAVRGMALGGGCEFVLHCDRVVAALESYIGLVEAGVGLVPAGGGLKECALRAAQESGPSWVFDRLAKRFELVGLAKVATSAQRAREFGYLRASDIVVFHPGELLHVAKAQAVAMFESGYRPPRPPDGIRVMGKTGVATIQSRLVNMRVGGYISDYDFNLGSRIAEVLCGGEVAEGEMVSEEYLLALERKHFLELLAEEKTQQRIEHTLRTGKPLRN